MASSSITTKDHDEIRNWAEERGGKPAHVSSTGAKGDIGILRIEFPGATASNDANLDEITWDQFFEKFDERGLALLYQEETAGGERSNFNKLVSSETADEGERRRPAAQAKKTARGKKVTPAKKTAPVKKSTPAKKTAVAKKSAPAKKASARKSRTAQQGGRSPNATSKSVVKRGARPGIGKKTGKPAHRPAVAQKSTKKVARNSAARRPAAKKSATRKRR